MVLVAVQSVKFPGHFLSLDGTHDDGAPCSPDGIGHAGVQTYVGPWETFSLERNVDGSVSFASIAFPGVYLRIDASKDPAVVNGQLCKGALERFNIVKYHEQDKFQGTIAIESQKSPGKFLSLDDKGVGVGGDPGENEEVQLLVIEP
ncbi:hypothetical protein BDZ91DRAFT_720936 [Kalaharituber pfeilii]|nr:hypothetical protein BDZ91DRAFT_720936 [Kalaharituber pfeilii]